MMKVRELLNLEDTSDSIESLVNDFASKTNKYRELKTISSLRSLQRTEEKLVRSLERNRVRSR
jgi:hypothetical protein